MRFEVYSHPLHLKYRSSLFTKASILQLVLFITLIVAPLLIAYRTSGFWVLENTYTEKPYVSFRHECLFLAKKGDGGSLFWSTYANLNAQMMSDSSFRIPLLSTADIDNDHNGKNDELSLEIKFPLAAGEDIKEFTAMLMFDYQLNLFSKVRLQGMGIVHESQSGTSNTLSVTGELKLKQDEILPHKGLNDEYDVPIIDSSSVFADSFVLSSLYQSYSARNLTTEIVYSMPSWSNSVDDANSFVAKIRVHYPKQQLRYKPGFIEMIKFAWIQYLSIFVIFLFVFDRFKVFVFQNQIFPSVPVYPTRVG